MYGVEITLGILLLLVVVTIFKGVKMVPQGYAWTVERFGKYTRTLTPGLHIIVPYMDGIGFKQNVMEQVLDIPPQEVISADNAMVTTDAVCFFQVLEPVKASYEVNDLPRALQSCLRSILHARF